MKVLYRAEDGEIMEADAKDIANWYMDCYERGNFRSNPPGTPLNLIVDYEAPFHEYDDVDYFIEELADRCSDEDRALIMERLKSL